MPLSIFVALVVCAMLRQASAFTSVYVFGDGLSTTTNVPGPCSPGLPEYYGARFCNGRVWVEVLAQRQGLTLGTNSNLSFFGHYSVNLVTNVANFAAPADVNTALFVVWVNSADFVDFMARFPAPYAPSDIPVWTNGMNQAISNHAVAIQTLYAKGVRNLVAPSAVDITKAPGYNYFAETNKAFVRARVIEFNNAFALKLAQIKVTHTNLAIASPDFFALTDAILASPTTYGMTNSTGNVIEDLANISFTGPGTNFVFWDYLHPTAKVHEILADTAHQLISTTRITSITSLGGSNQLTVVNMPVGLNGFVDGTTNLVAWSAGQGFNSTNNTQTITVPVNGPRWFYRLRFPFAWSWP